MSWQSYENVDINARNDPKIKESYSVTGDILSFQLCPRQYGFFSERNYQPAHVTQIWFGMIIHQVLDKLHMHYRGLLDEATEGQLPTNDEVEQYFEQVERSLRARGIKAINENVQELALRVLQRFNTIEGPTLFPFVEDTECKLQADEERYVLHGVVDVLRDTSHSRRARSDYDSVEIWDYKGSRYPNIDTEAGRQKLERYRFQMLVYAELYRRKHGRYPAKGILYFLNELDGTPAPIRRPEDATYEIDFRDPIWLNQVAEGMQMFEQTVHEIEECRDTNNWPSPNVDQRDKETCDICDKRWDCQDANYPMRYP